MSHNISDIIDNKNMSQKNNSIQNAKSVIKFTWKFILKFKIFFIILLVLSVAAAFDEVITPYLLDLVIKNFEHFTNGVVNAKVITKSIFHMLAMWLCFDVLYRLSGLLASYIYPLIESDVRMFMFKKVLFYRPSYFATESLEGSVENAVAETADGVQEIIEFIITTLIPGSIAILGCVLQIIRRNTMIGFLITLWAFFHILITVFLLNKSIKCSSALQETQNELAGKIVDSLINRNTTLQFNQQNTEFKYITKYQDKEVNAHRKLLLFNELIKFILNSLVIIVGIFLFLHTVSLFISHTILLSDVIFLFTTIFSIVRQVWQIGTQLIPFVEGLGQCAKGVSLLNDEMQLSNSDNVNIFTPKDDSIEFKNVTLYENNRCILNNISFTINSKTKVALIGSNGTGKTTIFRLILGLTSAYTGDVFIGKINIKNVNRSEVRKYCGVLSQKPYWFDRSIKENLHYGNPEATDQEIKEACEKACIYDFIMTLPEKWYTILNSNTLSGGQMQCLCLARLLISKPTILMGDEITTGLDIERQQFLKKFIKDFKGTVVLTTHNLDYREIFDKVIVLQNGQVADEGTDEELSKRSNIYQAMMNQFKI